MGYIQERGKNSYRLTVVIGYKDDGSKIYEYKTVKAKNPTEAKKLLTLFEAEILNGQYVKPEKMTLNVFFKDWLEKYADDPNNLSPDTRQNYINIFETRILPQYGHMKLGDIKTIHIVNFMNDLRKDDRRLDGKEGKLSDSTIANCYRAFNNVLSRATEWKFIKDNPAKGVKVPKAKSKKSDVYSKEELEKLLLILNDYPLHYRILIQLAVSTGARQGEIAALEWKHINMENNTILLEQSLTEVKKKGVQIKTTKNKRQRTVSIPKGLVTLLKKYKAQTNQERLAIKDQMDPNWQDRYFVFANEFGKPVRPDSIGQWWSRFKERHKIKNIRFHDLRHTSATLLINKGVHAKVISERLGHADISTTMNIYGHVLEEADQAAASHFDDLFENNIKKN